MGASIMTYCRPLLRASYEVILYPPSIWLRCYSVSNLLECVLLKVAIHVNLQPKFCSRYPPGTKTTHVTYFTMLPTYLVLPTYLLPMFFLLRIPTSVLPTLVFPNFSTYYTYMLPTYHVLPTY